MGDTQWPRYMVFEQQGENKPHQHAGTVHAPDAEMALLNARDVFVRRPSTVSQWVVRADAIYSKTQEEIDSSGWLEEISESEYDAPMVEFAVFCKLKLADPVIYTGKVTASSEVMALKSALDEFTNDDVLMWWIIPAGRIHKSDPLDNDSAFEPAGQKYFRHQTQFSNAMLLRKMTRDWRERQELD